MNEINSSRQSKINNESSSDIIAGIVFVLVFVLAHISRFNAVKTEHTKAFDGLAIQ